jgi:hypothetical protein
MFAPFDKVEDQKDCQKDESLDYTISCKDIQVLFVPSYSKLELINDQEELSEEEIELQFALLRRTEVSTTLNVSGELTATTIKVALQIKNEIDVRVTTSELTDLQLFTYRFR